MRVVMKSEKICSVFGHSEILKEDKCYLKPRLEREFLNLILNHDVKKFLFGGFGEFDDLCYQVVCELKNQFDRFYKLMGMPDYWNTHQNTHVDFKIYHLFVSLAAELKIPAMRSHQRIYVPASDSNEKLSLMWRMIEPFKSKLIDCWQHRAHKKGIASPEGLIVTMRAKDMNNIGFVFKNIKWGNHQVAEFVIHPATCNDSPFFGKIVDQRITEYNLFSDIETFKEIESCGIKLVNYSVLLTKDI